MLEYTKKGEFYPFQRDVISHTTASHISLSMYCLLIDLIEQRKLGKIFKSNGDVLGVIHLQKIEQKTLIQQFH